MDVAKASERLLKLAVSLLIVFFSLELFFCFVLASSFVAWEEKTFRILSEFLWED